MRVLVTLQGLYLNRHGRTVGKFQFSEKHGEYLLGGEPMTADAFNTLSASRDWDRLIEEHGARLRVRVVNLRTMDAARAALAASKGQAQKPEFSLD